MPNVVDNVAGILYEGDEIEVIPKKVYCQKRCKMIGRNTIVLEGLMADGTSIRVKCPRCRQLQTFAQTSR